MSTSKYRWYEVTKTFIVRANSQTDALAKVNGQKNVDATIASTSTSAERLPAAEARLVSGF